MPQYALQNPESLEASAETTLSALLEEIINLRSLVIDGAATRLSPYAGYYPAGQCSDSAQNLAHYLSLRRHDLRPLQERLAQAGLSSLGRCEGHVLGTLNQVANILGRALGAPIDQFQQQTFAERYTQALQTMEGNTRHLFGPRNPEREAYIMVTLPHEAALDAGLVRALIRQGMDCARINCAHDDKDTWESMAQLVRKLAAAEGRTCRILMDLAGHKIRTGPLEREPAVKHVHVRRNTLGAMVMPGEALIYRKGSAPAGQLSLPDEVFEQLQPDDRLRFVDTRGKKRSLHIVHRMASGPWLAQSKRSAYVAADTPFHWQRTDADGGFHTLSEQRFADFPGMPVTIRLHVGDKLLLTASQTPGRAAILNPVGEVMAPASIGCTHPEVVKALKVRDLVWIDDGKLGAVVTAIGPEGALLNIVHAHDKGVTVLAEKGLNFPSTPLNLPPLSQKDLRDLDTVCQLADMVGFSFVESLGDMECLIAALAQRGKPHLPIIAKIETARGVRHLPEILLGTLGRHPLGVMIARGDLAVELGGVRLAEIQEELLWLCEAAHVPVIWATQVLESLAKNGDLSRPEYTDAAMSGRADCVMLNKGPHIIKALSTLSDILQRMQAHQQKKTSRLRALHW